jgi:putative chitinase
VILIDLDKLVRITPTALDGAWQACACANVALVKAGVLSNPNRAAHFWGQVLHETSGLTVLVENLNYSAKRLTEVWPSRFPTLDQAQPFAHSPQALANKVYAGRNGNRLPDDGWIFRGRGFLQLTGRGNYERIGQAVGLDLVHNPDWVTWPEFGLLVAAEYWRQAGCNELADQDDIVKVTRAINGGLTGLDDRKLWLGRARSIVTGEVGG